ncbi:MAG: MBL fold metallo-hydrolase [Pseudomonadota bacterium]
MAEDPFRRDHAVTPGEVEHLAPGLRVVTAANASPMTFTGTRTYLVGEGRVALVDPGPDDLGHMAALRGALAEGETISHIFVTHSHLDHSPLAPAMAALYGAPVLGFGDHAAGRSAVMQRLARERVAIGGGEGVDVGFRPDRALSDGETVEGEGWALTAIHTPGHMSNHLCYAVEGTGALLTGDHVMGWATTVVSPPDGDLTAFMASLRRLQGREDDAIYYPGHGAPVDAPQALIAHILDHRLQREGQIMAILQDGAATLSQLVETIYADIDPMLHPAASRNVIAHLIDLMERELVAAGAGPLTSTAFSRRG